MIYGFGFSYWKHNFIKPFLNEEIIFINGYKKDFLQTAIEKGLCTNSKIYIWGRKSFLEVENYAKEKNISLFRVEDGFIRSVSLGSDLTKAYSLTIDSRGIYFDPTRESDLEYILNTYDFDDFLIERAKNIRAYIVKNKISKYNIHKDKELEVKGLKKNQTVVFVPGQVEDDASIVYGANGMSNLELLRQTRKNKPDAYIIYKPHPDVLVGNRKGDIPKKEALKYCDLVVEDIGLDSIFKICDEVHTMTSLVGFESLIRGKMVYTYGLPFYAGWGLTTDFKKCNRRTKKRTLDELVAATLILYPRYIHPKTNQICEIEALLEEIDKEKNRYNNDRIYKLYIDSINLLSRKIQLFIKVIAGE